MTNLDEEGGHMEERHKLTRKYLISLSEGLYLVSNLFQNPMQSSFAEEVSPLNLRKDQWNRIIEANVHQRLCHVFESEKEFIKWLAGTHYNMNKNKKQLAH